MGKKGLMRQAIVTKYLGPTDYRGSRIKASAAAGTHTTGYDSGLNTEENHETAARCLMNKFGWSERNEIIGGQMRNGDYCWVLVEKAVSK